MSNGLICWQLVKASRHGARWYADRPRDPWEGDPEAWRGGAASSGGGGSQKRAEKHAQRQAADAIRQTQRRLAEDAEMDSLLARVSEVGLSGLSGRERKRLEALSKHRGGRGGV